MAWDQDAPRRRPRIVARGAWSQDEFGDTTYYPENCRPEVFPPYDESPNDALRESAEALTGWGDLDYGIERNLTPEEASRVGGGRGGYAIHSEEVWARARADFAAGDTARVVCDRYAIKPGTFKDRSAKEGWRRGDLPDPEPFDIDAAMAGPAPDPADMAARALIHAQRAIAKGRGSEAATWLRTHRQLTRLVAEAALAEQGPPEPDPLDLITLRMKAVGEVARAATRLSPDNAAGHAAISGLIEEIRELPTGRRAAPAEPPVSDLSDLSDPVSPVARDPAPPADPETDAGTDPAADAEADPEAGMGAFPRFCRPDSYIVDPVARPESVAAPPQSPAGPMAPPPS